MTGFLDVLLRGLILGGQAVALGGVAFALVVLVPAMRVRPDLGPLRERTFLLIALGAAAIALAQGLALIVQLTALAGEGAWPITDVSETVYFRVGIGRIVMSVGVVAGVFLRRLEPGRTVWTVAIVACALALAVLSAGTSHAAARVEGRFGLYVLDVLHQVAASVWIGGLLHLLMTAFWRRSPTWPRLLLPRFSALALTAVGVLVVSGAALTFTYVDGVAAMTGTAYGMMVVTKIVLLGGLLILGALNFFEVRRLNGPDHVLAARLRRFVEVEFGVGVVVLLVAASLTSIPPAVDVVADRATLGEVVQVFTPKLPRLVSPAHGELPVDDRNAPRTDADRAWSEYNHHTAGFFVLTMGVLAIVSRTPWGAWARHWPLIFLGLAAFLIVRNDPGAWPLGPQGFWEGMTYPDVVQHRIAVCLVVAFALFEWAVRTGRLRSPRAALVFPLLCVAGGTLLLTHSHSSLNLKAEYLVEITHTPLGVLALFVGWARWLELRLESPENRLPGRLWPVAFTMVGVLLILYREV
ncbi:MAG: copper resistance D family protein [Candidatus Rokuibacteriota bacterium]